MNTYYIYKASNTINNMVYIGCTKDFEKRVKEHLRCSPRDDCFFHRELKRLGKENFHFEIIAKADGLEEGHRLERKYIEEYDSFRTGYNSTIGGFAAAPWNVRPIVCLDLDGNFVRRYESAGETKKDGFSDSNVLECCKGILKTCKGHMFMFEDDYLEHGSRKYEKQRPFNIVSVVQCDMQGNEIARFPSVEDAALATGIKRPMISSAITGKCKSASGFIFVYENDFPIKDIEAHVQRKKGRAVAQINPETGEVIKTYDRISDAGKALGVSYKAIHKVVDKEDRTAYGFKWVSQYANTEVNGQITKG